MTAGSQQIVLNTLSIIVVTIGLLLLTLILVKWLYSGRGNIGKFLMAFYIFFGLLLLAWPVGLLISVFLFDNPDPGNDLFVSFVFWSILSYPVIYLLSLIGSLILFVKKFLKASILFAILPILPSISLIWLLSPFLLTVFDLYNVAMTPSYNAATTPSYNVAMVPEENTLPPVTVSECVPPILDGGDGLDTTGCGVLEIGVIAQGTINSTSEAHNWQFSVPNSDQIIITIEYHDNSCSQIRVLASSGSVIESFKEENKFNKCSSASSSGGTIAHYYRFDPPNKGTYILRIIAPQVPSNYWLNIE